MSPLCDTPGVIMVEDQASPPGACVPLNILIFFGKIEIRQSSLPMINSFTVVRIKGMLRFFRERGKSWVNMQQNGQLNLQLHNVLEKILTYITEI